jgi:hypothetical protein
LRADPLAKFRIKAAPATTVAVRLSSVGKTVAFDFEVPSTVREQQRRKEQQAKLAECRSRE